MVAVRWYLRYGLSYRDVEELLAERGVRYVSFEDWQAIDQAEVGRGEPHGRPRVKLVRREQFAMMR